MEKKLFYFRVTLLSITILSYVVLLFTCLAMAWNNFAFYKVVILLSLGTFLCVLVTSMINTWLRDMGEERSIKNIDNNIEKADLNK